MNGASRVMRAIPSIGALVLACAMTLSAQVTAPAFEVASVKPIVAAGGLQQVGLQVGGRFTANVSLRQLIRVAYGLEENQLVGGPDWVNTTRFEIAALAGRDVSRDEALAMLRTLLADRFTLATHPETRQLPIYELVLARADGRWGSKMRRAETLCVGVTLPGLPASASPPPPPPAGPAQIIPLGVGTPLRCPSMRVERPTEN